MRNDAIVVIHGDHGSRIMQTAAQADIEALPHMRRQDFLDNFSTLFAVRMPDLPSGRDDRMLPIDELLRRTMRQPELLSKPAEGDDEPSPTVLLGDRGGRSYEAVALPLFSSLDEAGPLTRAGD
jgi:hypothetical protein